MYQMAEMPPVCRCGCGKRVALKGMLTGLRARTLFSSTGLKKMTKGGLRRLTDPDGLNGKYEI